MFDVRSQAWVMDVGSFIDAQFGSVRTSATGSGSTRQLYASQWKKPILVIHGGKDFRVPTEQGIAAYNAARRAGVPTKLVIFPDENHWILKPQNSVQWYRHGGGLDRPLDRKRPAGRAGRAVRNQISFDVGRDA